MTLTLYDGWYTCKQCPYDQRFIPKNAAFNWHAPSKEWRTQDINKAVTLAAYADATCRDKLVAHLALMRTSVEASRAANADIEIPCPEGLALLPFQRAGVLFISTRPFPDCGCLIADEMGTGKSIESIAFCNFLKRKLKILIVSPASLKFNWQCEAQKWLLIKHTIGIASGTKTALPDTDVVIINYDILKAHAEHLAAVKWDVIICDEIHYCKSQKTARGKAMLQLKAPYRLALSGTPMMNRPVELQTTLQWLAPLTWGNRWQFAQRYCGLKQTRFGTDMSGATNLAELNTRLRSQLMLRRLKRDVMTELPPKFRQLIELPADGLEDVVQEEWVAHKRFEEATHALRVALHMAKAAESDADYHLAITALRQGQSAAFQEMAKMRVEVAKKKLPFVIHHLQDCISPEHKVVAFATHYVVLDPLHKTFENSALVCGEVPLAQRHAEVQRFQNDPSCLLFIGGIKAAGVGLTLTASSHCVFAEAEWTPSWLNQAEDRLHRIGAKDNVLVQHLVLQGSLDAVMLKRVMEKQKIITAALDDQADPDVLVEDIMATAEQGTLAAVTRKQVKIEALALTPEAIHLAHVAVKYVSALCDNAMSIDKMGFSRFDTDCGKSLASLPMLSARQGVLAMKLAIRYRAQIPDDLANKVMSYVHT